MISWVLFFNWLNLSLIHMICDYHFLFLEVNCDFSYLLFGRLFRIFFKLSWHFMNTNFSNMIIIVKWIFSCVYFIFLSFAKSYTLRYQTIITIYIQFNRSLSNLFYSFYQAIWISIWVVIYDPHTTINLSNFFPMWHFSWAIIFNGFKLKWITIFSFKLVASMFIEVSNLTNFYFFIILSLNNLLPHKVYIS